LAFTISLSTAALADEQRFQKLEQRQMELIKKNALQEQRIEKLERNLSCTQHAIKTQQNSGHNTGLTWAVQRCMDGK
jgi:membrane protein involved in colicin uptake